MSQILTSFLVTKIFLMPKINISPKIMEASASPSLLPSFPASFLPFLFPSLPYLGAYFLIGIVIGIEAATLNQTDKFSCS